MEEVLQLVREIMVEHLELLEQMTQETRAVVVVLLRQVEPVQEEMQHGQQAFLQREVMGFIFLNYNLLAPVVGFPAEVEVQNLVRIVLERQVVLVVKEGVVQEAQREQVQLVEFQDY
jgi:hypothetical protein